MLAYLDALVAAVTARQTSEIERLLAHPLARVLTREARAEAQAAVVGTGVVAPLRLLQLHHQTRQLLAGRADAEEPAEYERRLPPSVAAERRPAAVPQIELPLSA